MQISIANSAAASGEIACNWLTYLKYKIGQGWTSFAKD